MERLVGNREWEMGECPNVGLTYFSSIVTSSRLDLRCNYRKGESVFKALLLSNIFVEINFYKIKVQIGRLAKVYSYRFATDLNYSFAT